MNNYLLKLIKEYCYKEGDFVLSSGKNSNYYINIKNLVHQFKGMRQLTAALNYKLAEIAAPIDVIVGIELGSVSLATLIAFSNSKPMLTIRKNKKGFGADLLVEGFERGKTKEYTGPIIIEDVVTTGNTTIKAAHEIRRLGIPCSKVLCVVDREEGGKEALKYQALDLISLTTLSEIRDYNGQ
jgi:orotate phosphoribosyltransferase